MSQKSLSQEYAQAIYAIALEGWQKSLGVVHKKLAASPDLMAQLNNTQTPFTERQKQLDAVLPSDLTEQRRNFFYTLLKNGHLNLLEDIATNLTRLTAKGPGVEIASVTTAIPLSDDEKARFQAKLAARYGDNLAVDFVVDEKIIGGAIVQVGDKIIDGSLASKLDVAQERLSVAIG